MPSSPIAPPLRCAPTSLLRRSTLACCSNSTANRRLALACWADALQKDAARIALLNQRARLLEQLGQLADAEAAMRASLTIQHDQPDVIQHWLHVRQRMCQWPILSDAIRGLSPDDLMASCGPLAALALTDQVAVQARIASAWIERKILPAPEHLAPPDGYRHDRIRIGYLSSDFCRHAMSYLIAELFERHDRSRFEVHGYCTSPEDGSDIRRRVIAAFDHFTIIKDMTDEHAARTIRADEIDILIDLNGLTTGTRLAILRWRPAPIQATYLGFIGPVPMPELDFLLCDEFVIPPAFAALYQPQPLYVGPNYQANDRKRVIGKSGLTFDGGSAGGSFRILLFLQSLQNHRDDVPRLDGDPAARAGIGAVAGIATMPGRATICARAPSMAGVDPARVLFAERVDPAEYMARLALPDLFLDTFPYNAGTIASDAIRMGLPLVTLSGESFASRMAARLLQAIGAAAGIGETIEHYIEIAVACATQPDLFAGYRTLFTEANWAATIGDIATFTYHYEESLMQIERALRTQHARAGRAGRRRYSGSGPRRSGRRLNRHVRSSRAGSRHPRRWSIPGRRHKTIAGCRRRRCGIRRQQLPRNGPSPLMALRVERHAPARPRPLYNLATGVDGLLTPLAYGIGPPIDGQPAWYVICQAPSGPPVSHGLRPWPEARTDRFRVAADRRSAGATADHAASPIVGFVPTTSFNGQPNRPVTLGAAWSAPPAMHQPAVCETAYTALCHPAARGEGRTADDVYALGVLLVTLALGRLPLDGADDRTIMYRKLELGDFVAITGGERLPPMLYDLTRSMLAEDPDHRPTPALLRDPSGARGRRVAARPASRAQRSFKIGAMTVWNNRTLALAMALDPAEALTAIQGGTLMYWLRRGLGDSGLAVKLEELVRQNASGCVDGQGNGPVAADDACHH